MNQEMKVMTIILFTQGSHLSTVLSIDVLV